MIFPAYRQAIMTVETDSILQPADIPASMLMHDERALTVYYTPFEYINTAAKVVLVGITPGLVQWRNAIRSAQQSLRDHNSDTTVLLEAKRAGAFSGPMRPNLVAMLDHIGLQRTLRLASCAALFEDANSLVHTTSVLRHAVFYRGENYNGTPDMLKTPLLRQQLLAGFGSEIRQLPDALYIPLGPRVAQALDLLVKQGQLDEQQVLGGLPHPSGANAERIAYFLGRKAASQLSNKTNPAVLDHARQQLQQKVARFG